MDRSSTPAIIFIAIVLLVVSLPLLHMILSTMGKAFSTLGDSVTNIDSELGASKEDIIAKLGVDMVSAASSVFKLITDRNVVAALIVAGILTAAIWINWR